MQKATYLFISEVGQNRKQVLSGLINIQIERNEDYKQIIHSNFEIIKPKSFSSNSDEQQKRVKRLADLKLRVNMIFICIRYERLDMMNFRLKTLIKYFQPYRDNICLIITDYHKSQKKEQDYDVINRKLATLFEIKFLYAYYQEDNQSIFYNKTMKIRSPNQFFFKQIFKTNIEVELDGNKMGVYPQIDYQLLQKMQSRFKSMDPRQIQVKHQKSEIHDLSPKDKSSKMQTNEVRKPQILQDQNLENQKQQTLQPNTKKPFKVGQNVNLSQAFNNNQNKAQDTQQDKEQNVKDGKDGIDETLDNGKLAKIEKDPKKNHTNTRGNYFTSKQQIQQN